MHVVLQMNIEMKCVVLLLFIAMLIIPVSASDPIIDTWCNDKTNNDTTYLTICINETVKFNVTANQSIDFWNWTEDNVDVQDNNYDNFSTSWESLGEYNISINATNNTNGTSNTITWTVTVEDEEEETISIPEITSWCNNKTNDAELNTIIINTNETIKFNVTANQSINTWNWSKDNVDVQDNNYDNFTTYWEDPGIKTLSVNGTNSNGSDTITWKVTVLEQQRYRDNDIILFSSPQVVDYVYVNDTINETITYSITTAESLENICWTVINLTGVVNTDPGTVSGNTYSYDHTWDIESIVSPYKVIVNGSHNGSQVKFTWYVNVYEIGDYSGGHHIFGIIDGALRNAGDEVKIRMEKRKVIRLGDKGKEYLAQKVNLLHEEIDKRQSTRAALLDDYKSGKISKNEYVAALQQSQLDAKSNQKLAQEYAKIAKSEMKNEKRSSKGDDDPEGDDASKTKKEWPPSNNKKKG